MGFELRYRRALKNLAREKPGEGLDTTLNALGLPTKKRFAMKWTVSMGAVSIMQPYIKDGRMRALGVPSAARSPLLPQVPTVSEAGVPGFEWRTWGAFLLPLGAPQPVAERLNAELVKAVAAPDVRDKLIAQGLEPIGSPPETVTQWTREGLARMRDIVQRAKIQAE